MAITRSGIPTTYAKSNFRSRLEARWAAFFDLVDWHWTYEPLDSDGYIPDFLIHGRDPIFVEIGPCITKADFQEKSMKARARASELRHDVAVLGITPAAAEYVHEPGRFGAGLLLEWLGDEQGFAGGAALWGRCVDCHKLGLVHDQLSYHLRPCGHHQSGGFGDIVDGVWLEEMWRLAGNDVQWRP